jgi:hypothetical protein
MFKQYSTFSVILPPSKLHLFAVYNKNYDLSILFMTFVEFSALPEVFEVLFLQLIKN